MCENTYFIVFYENNEQLATTNAKKNDNFSHFAKHRLIKKNVMLQPPLDPKLVFLNFSFKKDIDVEQKTKLKIRKKSKDKERGLERKRREETNKNQKGLINKNFVI